MADRSLRGMRLGSQSLQSEEGVEFSPRKKAVYQTADGTTFDIVFAAEAEIPDIWQSPKSGQEGRLLSADGKPVEIDAVTSRCPEPTGTCCSSGAHVPSSRSSSRSGSTYLRARKGQHKIGA